MFPFLFIALLTIAVAATVYDVILTERGIKAGLGVEGFTWLVGSNPSAFALCLRDALILAIVAAVALLLYKANVPLGYGALTGFVVAARKHYTGGREWARLLDGGKPQDLTVSKTAWQKFLEG